MVYYFVAVTYYYDKNKVYVYYTLPTLHFVNLNQTHTCTFHLYTLDSSKYPFISSYHLNFVSIFKVVHI